MITYHGYICYKHILQGGDTMPASGPEQDAGRQGQAATS